MISRKNIAIITQSLDGGGAERMAANMSIELSKYYNVYLFVFSSRQVEYDYGGTLVRYKGKYRRSNLHSILSRIVETRRLKKKYNIDCSISHQDRPNLFNALSGGKAKVICCLHTSPTSVMKPLSRRAILQKMACKRSYKYLGVSKVAVLDLVEKFSFPRKKVDCIYNFVNINLIRDQSMLPLEDTKARVFFKEHDYTIISVGRFLKTKGHQHLLRALKLLRSQGINCGAVILGQGETKPAIESLVTALELSTHVYMPGQVMNPFQYIQKATVFVLASGYEGLPMALIEAAACGCPLISTDVITGPREILAPHSDLRKMTDKVEDVEYGILTPRCLDDSMTRLEADDGEAQLADAIKKMILDEKYRLQYAIKAGECADNFGVQAIVPEWRKLIDGEQRYEVLYHYH